LFEQAFNLFFSVVQFPFKAGPRLKIVNNVARPLGLQLLGESLLALLKSGDFCLQHAVGRGKFSHQVLLPKDFSVQKLQLVLEFQFEIVGWGPFAALAAWSRALLSF
jgi:hypothetical protein